MADDRTPHYHVVIMCREHGPQNMVIVQDEQEGLEYVHSRLFETFKRERGDVEFTNMYSTPNFVEAEMHLGDDVHPMIAFLGICRGDYAQCRMALQLEAMSKAQELLLRGGEGAERVQEILNRMLGGVPPIDVEEQEVDPSVFNSIEEYLKNQQQEGDGPTH